MIKLISLPGISSDYLAKAQVCHVAAATATHRCGLPEPGILFPYFNFHGEPVEDGGFEFARLRLDQPRGDQKYHQRTGTRPHAYLPPSLWAEDKDLNSLIFIVEGEKKALALAEAGFNAIGIGGFYNFRDSDGALVPELSEVLGYITNPVFIFYGDQDVVYNYQFSHAAHTFAELVAPAHVLASCVPLDAPGKGLDDCRHALGEQFSPWFTANSSNGVGIGKDTTTGSIASGLLRLQVPYLAKLQSNDREEAAKGVSKLAAGLRGFPLEQESVIDIAVKELKFKRRVFNSLVKNERQKLAADFSSMELGPNSPLVVNLSEQPGTWTRQVLDNIGTATYVYGGNLCDLNEETGLFEPHTPASLVPYIDAPDCCRFVRNGQKGELQSTHLAEKDTRLILGALRQHQDVLQPVETLAHVPVLVWSPDGPQIITGYSREHKILATEGEIDLPEPATAAAGLLELIRDFDFATPGDAGRAIASLLTPALMNGRFLDSGRSPFFMSEKDQKGAGAGTFMQMLAATYGTKPCSITPADPKSAREDLSKHLLEGANFIYFDNIRGIVLALLPFFESILTEPNFTCRAPYVHGNVNVTRCVFGCTSNGALLSGDLADRTVKIAIRKQPGGYSYHPWPEGHLIDHVVATRTRYLACIYSLIRAWALANRPSGANLTGFRFRQWERACVWILENFFPHLPLLDPDHKVSQQRMADPDYDLLRAIFRAALDRRMTSPVTATDLVRIAVQANRMQNDEQATVLKMGRILSKEFPQEGPVDFANEFRIVRHDVNAGQSSNYEKQKTYAIMPIPGKKLPREVPGPTGPSTDTSACPSPSSPPPSAVPVAP